MHKQDYFLVNEPNKILWDFKIKADQIFPVRRENIVMINKQKKRKENLS